MGPKSQALPEIEVVSQEAVEQRPPRDPGRRPSGIVASGVLTLIVVAALLSSWLMADSSQPLRPAASAPTADQATPGSTVRAPGDRARGGPILPDVPLPAQLIAVERYRLAPGAATARGLLDSIGGIEALVVSSVATPSDHVAFDPADPDRLVASSAPVSASIDVEGTRFTLTPSALVAERGGRTVTLDAGEAWAWIDSPVAGVVLAYPSAADGVTAAWDAASLERLGHHPFAGHQYQRLAVSGDRRTAVAVTSEGLLAAVDPASGVVMRAFGSLDPAPTAAAVTLDQSGTIAITVDRDRTVGVWWVGDDRPLAVVEPNAGAAGASPAIHPVARRIAVRNPATWRIIDTELESWIERACDLADRRLTRAERRGLDLASPSHGCG